MSIHDIRDAGAVRAAIAEYDRVGRTHFLEKYVFGRSREYMLLDTASGRIYDSKAIVGATYGYAFPERGPLRASEFRGGEATVESLLAGLGFEVVRIGQDWGHEQVEGAVQDYFEMLRLEATGQMYNKSEHNDALRQRLMAQSNPLRPLEDETMNSPTLRLRFLG